MRAGEKITQIASNFSIASAWAGTVVTVSCGTAPQPKRSKGAVIYDRIPNQTGAPASLPDKGYVLRDWGSNARFAAVFLMAAAILFCGRFGNSSFVYFQF